MLLRGDKACIIKNGLLVFTDSILLEWVRDPKMHSRSSQCYLDFPSSMEPFFKKGIMQCSKNGKIVQ